jgi:hypothetical protein
MVIIIIIIIIRVNKRIISNNVRPLLLINCRLMIVVVEDKRYEREKNVPDFVIIKY